MMKTLSNARTIFAAAAFFALPMVAKADTDKTNPVTGETETYEVIAKPLFRAIHEPSHMA